ncbi:hypothetical protein TrCOL_g23 [Triparma columacea]|uniref:Uncharacterized protein n=1 Tax=Triparma columacea TaxID=722753 RepID=A0A9W7FXR4_9STRA|nr:hypothetical protein TrCOL_g23 [Triparma columacea]
MSDVVTSNVQFTATSSSDFTYECNNLGGQDTSLSCAASYVWTSTMTQSLTVSSSLTLTEGLTISLKEDFEVVDATEGVSLAVSESFSQSETTTTSESYALDSACTVDVDPGECVEIVGTFEYGILNADYTATLTCSSGVSSSSSGTMEFDNVYSTELQDSCTTTSCPD